MPLRPLIGGAQVRIPVVRFSALFERLVGALRISRSRQRRGAEAQVSRLAQADKDGVSRAQRMVDRATWWRRTRISTSFARSPRMPNTINCST
jgi:hypothetical protein